MFIGFDERPMLRLSILLHSKIFRSIKVRSIKVRSIKVRSIKVCSIKVRSIKVTLLCVSFRTPHCWPTLPFLTFLVMNFNRSQCYESFRAGRFKESLMYCSVRVTRFVIGFTVTYFILNLGLSQCYKKLSHWKLNCTTLMKLCS